MKKTLTIISFAAMLCILILCSCNFDATIGIYAEVSTSTPNKNVTLVNYLGQDSSEKYYYQLDDGVYRTGATLFQSSTNSRIVGSYLDGDKLYVMKETIPEGKATESEVTISLYTDPADTSTKVDVTWTPAEGELLTRLFTNGIVLSNMNVYRIDGTALHKIETGLTDCSIISGMESEDYAFICLYDNTASKGKFLVVDNASDTLHVNIDSDGKVCCGFQFFTDGHFILFYRDNSSNKSYAKKLTSSGIEDSAVPLKSSLAKSSTYNASFLNPANTKQVIVKCTNYFDVIDFTDPANIKVTPVNKGYASDICTADIANFKVVDDHLVVVGTVSSLLYLIDMSNTSKTPVEIK